MSGACKSVASSGNGPVITCTGLIRSADNLNKVSTPGDAHPADFENLQKLPQMLWIDALGTNRAARSTRQKRD